MTQSTPGAEAPPQAAIASALTRFQFLAYATGVFLLMLSLHVGLTFAQADSQGVPYSEASGLGRWIPGGDTWIPAVHGWLYLAYVIVAVDLWMRTRLPLVRTVLVVMAGTVPVMSFVAERWVTNQLRPTLADPVGGTGS